MRESRLAITAIPSVSPHYGLGALGSSLVMAVFYAGFEMLALKGLIVIHPFT
jgi:hypothetical protein